MSVMGTRPGVVSAGAVIVKRKKFGRMVSTTEDDAGVRCVPKRGLHVLGMSPYAYMCVCVCVHVCVCLSALCAEEWLACA